MRRQRVLVVGCGDVGLRCVAQLRRAPARVRIFALTREPARRALLRAAGATPIVADLDARASLARLAGLAPIVLHLAPPDPQRDGDPRTRALIAALGARRSRARPAIARRAPRVVYASTTGVYGDCGGALIDETHRARPVSARARRRVCAERLLRRATARGALTATIARVPGIYAANRLPLARLAKGTPALVDADDVYTSHIHADDLAALLVRMITHGRPARVVHACDDSALKMGDWFDRVADAFGLARAPRVSRVHLAEAAPRIDPLTLSFMRASRRLANDRLKRELRMKLRYPDVDAFLRALRQKPRAE